MWLPVPVPGTVGMTHRPRDRAGTGRETGPTRTAGTGRDDATEARDSYTDPPVTPGDEPTRRNDGWPTVTDEVRAYTVRLELVDEPGELLRALEPIASNGGNLLSIFHERGNVTPRGHIPVEVDLETTPERFEIIVEALRDAGVNVIRAGADRYGEELAVVLVGHLVDTDLSDTLSRVEVLDGVSVADVSLTGPEGIEGESAARLRLVAPADGRERALETVRELAAEKDLRVIEPLADGGEA
jgi:ACT domain-containing protein